MADHDRMVVYVPGLDGTGQLLFQQHRLNASYDVRCIAYPQDMRHTYDDLVDLAVEPLERAGGGTVLAESFGGGVALSLALRRPELVQRLILVNTFAWFPRRIIIDLFAAVVEHLPGGSNNPATQPLRNLIFFSRGVPATVRQEWWRRTAGVPMSAMGHRLKLIQGLDLRPRLHQIQAPTLIIAAPNDLVVPCRAGVAMARKIRDSRIIFPRVGHAALVHPSIDIAELLESQFAAAPAQA